MNLSRSKISFIALAIIGAIMLVLPLSELATARNQSSPATRSDDEQRMIEVYKHTNESVVFISTITLTVDPYDFFAGVQPREGTGSGMIVDPQKGIVVTNLHVIQDAHEINIFLANNQSYKARLLGVDKEYDLAVLQLINPPEGLIGVEFANSAGLEVGQRVLAIGNPHGLNRTLTSGIISSLNRTVRNPNNYLMKGLIQTDAAINPGNSGGPLLDMDGRLIGINTAILSASGDSAGIGFAVPVNQIKRVLPELIATGRILRPKIGWLLIDTNQGPLVRRIVKGGPAELVGVQPFEREVKDVFRQGFVRDLERADLIYRVNGKRVASREEVEEILMHEGHEPVKFTLRTGGVEGREREVTITPVYR